MLGNVARSLTTIGVTHNAEAGLTLQSDQVMEGIGKGKKEVNMAFIVYVVVVLVGVVFLGCSLLGLRSSE